MLATTNGCRSSHCASSAPLVVAAGADRPGVVRIEVPIGPNARIQGSMIPVGNGMALTALHILTQPVGRVDGTLTGLDAQVSGRSPDTGAEDWVLARVNDARLPDAAPLAADHPAAIGDTIYLFGFPSRYGVPDDAVRVEALVADTPSAEGDHPELIFLRVEGDPDLGGMSGGPACVRGREGRWVVVGMYVGRWERWPWRTCYVVRRIPREVLEQIASSASSHQRGLHPPVENNGETPSRGRVTAEEIRREGGLFRRVDGPESRWELVCRWTFAGPRFNEHLMRGISMVPDPADPSRNAILSGLEDPPRDGGAMLRAK